jgi:hypothetical protein
MDKNLTTDLENEIRRLQNIVSRMTMKAHAGLCQRTMEGKHEFLRDISRLGQEYGYDILGLPAEGSGLPEPQWYAN